MEFIINNLQIIKYSTLDNTAIREFLNYHPEKPTARTIKSAFLYGGNIKFKIDDKTYIVYSSKFILDQRGKLLGVRGHINERIKNYLSINSINDLTEWYINREYVCSKFLKWIEKYADVDINLLSENSFNNFCASPINIMQDRNLTRLATEDYLKRNFPNIKGLELIGIEDSNINTITEESQLIDIDYEEEEELEEEDDLGF